MRRGTINDASLCTRTDDEVAALYSHGRLRYDEAGNLVYDRQGYYTENIGAYSSASSTKFNGFPGPKTLHINQ